MSHEEIENLRRRVEELERRLLVKEQEEDRRRSGASRQRTRAFVSILIVLSVLLPTAVSATLLVPGFQPRLVTVRSTVSTTLAPSTGGACSTPATVTISMPPGAGSGPGHNFDQPAITVKPCTKITWVDNDNTDHSTTSDSVPAGAEGWDSVDQSPGDTFSVVFVVPGEYKYHCSFHPAFMRGTITVTSS